MWGTWKIDRRPFNVHGMFHISNGSYIVGQALGQTATSEKEALANARLIAAAPDMLEALRPFAEVDYEELIGAPDDMPIEEALYKEDQPTVGDLRRAMEALAKAEGRS